MHRIKLDAIGSTNTFLKELAANKDIENYTIVTAEVQLEGRGQMGAVWESSAGKNLLFSMYTVFDAFLISDATYLNYAVSLAVYEVLKDLEIKNVSIKWPNDILTGASKISGILIENTLRKSTIKHSVIGVGLNVNQDVFPEGLDGATSVKQSLGKEVDKELLLQKLIKSLKKELSGCKKEKFSEIKSRYLSVLYKKNIPTMFKDSEDKIFIGKIVDVSIAGQLLVELEDENVKAFELKEIQFLKL